jgi:selenocysteine lyase/cysteine desulfurase
LAFTIDGLSSQDVAAELARQGIGVGAGNFYAVRLLQALGIDTADGVVRASFVHYTTSAEVQRLVAALQALLR